MSVPSLSTADFNEEGFFMHTRAIERLALAIQQLGGSFGDNNAKQGEKPFTLGLAPGIFNPAKVEIGGDGNIVSVSDGTGFSGLPSSSYSGSGYTIKSSGTTSGNSYPFANLPGSFTSNNGFPALSFSGSGASSVLTGFDSTKTYMATMAFNYNVATSSGFYYFDILRTISDNSLFSTNFVQNRTAIQNTIGHTMEDYASVDSATFVFTGISSLYCRLAWSMPSPTFAYLLSSPGLVFVQLN